MKTNRDLAFGGAVGELEILGLYLALNGEVEQSGERLLDFSFGEYFLFQGLQQRAFLGALAGVDGGLGGSGVSGAPHGPTVAAHPSGLAHGNRAAAVNR